MWERPRRSRSVSGWRLRVRTLPLDALPRAVLTALSRFWLVLLRVYLVAAVGLLVVRVTQIALHR